MSTCTDFRYSSNAFTSSNEKKHVKTTTSFNKPDTTTEEVAQYLLDLSNENKQGSIVGSNLVSNSIPRQITDTIKPGPEMQSQFLLNDNRNRIVVESHSISQHISKTTESEHNNRQITLFTAIPSHFSIPASSTSLHISTKEVPMTTSTNSFGNIPNVSKEVDFTIKNQLTCKKDDTTDLAGSVNNSMEEPSLLKKTIADTARQHSSRTQNSGSNVLTKMSVDDIAMKLQKATTLLQNSLTPAPPVLSSSDSMPSISTTSPKNEKEVPKKELIPDISSFLRKEMMKILPDMLQQLYPAAQGKIMH